MDKKLLALLSCESHPAEATLTKIPQGLRLFSGTAGVYRGYFSGKSLGKYYNG